MASAQDNNPSSSATPLRYPGIRPETRSKVIEILAGNANGCLQELGYTPQMLDRMQFLQQQNEVWKQENVKLFQDNTKLMYDNKALTEHNAKLLVTNKELHIHLDALYSANRTYEQFREKEGSNILKEYANLQWHYKAAVEQLKQLAASQPPASGSKQLNANTQHTPTISAQPQRRASAGVPQVHSPLGSQQPYAYQQQQPLSPNVAQTWRNETVPAIVQQRPHPVSQQHASQYVASHPVPRVPHWPSHTPEQSHLPNTYSSVGPVPLNAPVVAVALSHYTNQGNITPQLPPTPPMSALPLALQNFASPATLRSVPSSSSHRVPPRTASSTSSSFHRTPVFAHSPPLPPAATSQSAPRPSPPTALTPRRLSPRSHASPSVPPRRKRPSPLRRVPRMRPRSGLRRCRPSP
ncbi:hypothetical protein B0H10DRAFT_104505 [Mycena sp. CBHHK59/15]|nr:hypothetical protein B0H10DRAFT_104505 [Mycena sp. CBHHK59/15]